MFWKLLEESILIQSVVTLLIVITTCLMYLLYRQIPFELLNITLLILGYWFGSKTQYSLMKGGK